MSLNKTNAIRSFTQKFKSMQISFYLCEIILSGIFPIQWPISSNNMCDI